MNILTLMGGLMEMEDFKKFYEKWGKKVQKLGIIFQIDDKMCLYFTHLCVHGRELLFLLSYYSKYSESVDRKFILQMGDFLRKKGKWGGRRPNGGFRPQIGDLKTWRTPIGL